MRKVNQENRERALLILLSFKSGNFFLLSLLFSLFLFLRLGLFQFFSCLSSRVTHAIAFFLIQNKDSCLFSFVLWSLATVDINNKHTRSHLNRGFFRTIYYSNYVILHERYAILQVLTKRRRERTKARRGKRRGERKICLFPQPCSVFYVA